MVEGIPPQLRSAPKLRAFFEQLFPGQVYGVQMTLDLSELEACVQRRSGVRNQLERAVAVWEATGVRPRTWVSQSRAQACSHPQHAPLPPALLPRLLGRDVYDAIDQLCLELQALNSLVAALQAKYHAQTLADGTDEACLDQSHGTYGKMEMGIKRTLASFKHAQVSRVLLFSLFAHPCAFYFCFAHPPSCPCSPSARRWQPTSWRSPTLAKASWPTTASRP